MSDIRKFFQRSQEEEKQESVQGKEEVKSSYEIAREKFEMKDTVKIEKQKNKMGIVERRLEELLRTKDSSSHSQCTSEGSRMKRNTNQKQHQESEMISKNRGEGIYTSDGVVRKIGFLVVYILRKIKNRTISVGQREGKVIQRWGWGTCSSSLRWGWTWTGRGGSTPATLARLGRMKWVG